MGDDPEIRDGGGVRRNGYPHIAIVSTSYPYPGKAGEVVAPFAACFAKELAKHARVSVLAAGPSAFQSRVGNLYVEHFRSPVFPVSRLSILKPWHWPAIIRVVCAGQAELEKKLDEEVVDVVLACWALPAGLWAMRACCNRGIPYAVWCLGSDILVAGRLPLLRGLIRSVLSHAAVRFADGIALRDEVSRLSGCDCRFLPTTRELCQKGTRRLRTRPPYRMTFLGRWHRVKGIDLLLQALARFTDEDWACIEAISIAGGGSLEREVRNGCAALQRQGRPVALFGFLDGERVEKLLAATDYLLIPSRSDSIPVVFSEAMRASCPVIATPVGDLPWLLETYKVGVLADEVSADALMRAMRRAMEQPPTHFAASMRNALELFALETHVDQLMTEARRMCGMNL